MYFIISWSLSFQLNIHGIDNDEREPEEQENRQQQQQRKRANEQISRELNHILAVMARPNMNVCETAASSGTGTGCYSSTSPICQPGDETGICWSSPTGAPMKERTKGVVLDNAVLLPRQKYKNPTIIKWYASPCYIRQDVLRKTLWWSTWYILSPCTVTCLLLHIIVCINLCILLYLGPCLSSWTFMG